MEKWYGYGNESDGQWVREEEKKEEERKEKLSGSEDCDEQLKGVVKGERVEESMEVCVEPVLQVLLVCGAVVVATALVAAAA